jgi:predicted HTH domain antitoxin
LNDLQRIRSGAEEYVLLLVSEGKLSMGRAAELLELSAYDIQRLAQERGIERSATADQYEKARETAEKLGRKLSILKGSDIREQ